MNSPGAGSHRHQSGHSVMEVLIALALCALVLGALAMTVSTGWKSGRAAERSAAVTAAALLETTLDEDVRQLGVDARTGNLLLCRPDAIAFYRVILDRPECVRLRPVRYERVPSANGNWRLLRSEGAAPASSRVLASLVLESVSFQVLRDPTGHVLLVKGSILDDDVRRTAPRPASSSLPFRLVLRIPAPDDLGNPALEKAMRCEPEAPLSLSRIGRSLRHPEAPASPDDDSD